MPRGLSRVGVALVLARSTPAPRCSLARGMGLRARPCGAQSGANGTLGGLRVVEQRARTAAPLRSLCSLPAPSAPVPVAASAARSAACPCGWARPRPRAWAVLALARILAPLGLDPAQPLVLDVEPRSVVRLVDHDAGRVGGCAPRGGRTCTWPLWCVALLGRRSRRTRVLINVVLEHDGLARASHHRWLDVRGLEHGGDQAHVGLEVGSQAGEGAGAVAWLRERRERGEVVGVLVPRVLWVRLHVIGAGVGLATGGVLVQPACLGAPRVVVWEDTPRGHGG